MGEKFAVNPVTGTGSLSVPLAASPGRSGFGPELSLAYDSGAGNGPFGFGWSLSLPAVTRKTDKGLPRYLDGDESDVFILSGAEDLVPVLDDAGMRISFPPRTVHGVEYTIRLYRPRIEGLFARIERWTNTTTGISHWRTITRDNVTTLFGFDANSRIADPRDPRRVFSCLISLTFDDKGNAAHYVYVPEDFAGIDRTTAHESNRTEADRGAQRYLKHIFYGNAQPYFPDWLPGGVETPLPADWHFHVVLDYGDHAPDTPVPTRDHPWPVRPDPFSTYRPGFEVRTYRRCKRVLVFHNFPNENGVGADCLVRSSDFVYSEEVTPADSRNPIYTFLESVTQTGYRRTDAGYDHRSTPPLEFFYSQPEIHAEVLTLADLDSRQNLPEGLDGARYRWVDLDGEGLSGMLMEQDGGWSYKRNLSPLNATTIGGERVAGAQFGPQERVPTLPVPAQLGGGQQLLDLTGGGKLDLVTFDGPVPGYFARTAEEGWETLKAFTSLPRINWSEPNLQFVDVTGDGRADVLITEDDVYTFYPSLGPDGFGEAERVRTPWEEERGPRVVFADGTQTVSLADVSGDGLSDIVRVRNGEVCYWPNLGYGRFGAKVTMDNSPRFADENRFDPRRIRFADVDGSGTADLLYVGENGVQVCFNQSGNSWASPHLLAVFPSADKLNSVQALDLLGNGTSCLVWSSPLPAESYAPLRYVDLMGSQKPHLLVRMRNNLGAETCLAYAPSTRFYLADKQAGRPWITRLPFPVHVVERVETYDWIGRSRFVTQYAYHHGYFDGEEREFRGFGMVEQRDTEEHHEDTLFPNVETTNEDAASFNPPVLTRTWFHTGAFVEAGVVTRQYAHEYWVEPAMRGDSLAAVAARQAMLVPDSFLPPGLSAQETREAYRALKGSTLRIEVYAEDRPTRIENPYMVTEQNFSARRLQSFGPNQHAVFMTHPREALTYHYERAPDDPRATHDFTLEVDDFGNVRRSASVAYGRRPGYPEPEPNLSADFRTMLAHDQTRMHVAATASRFTDPVNQPTDAVTFDVYRAPLPCETITAELTGITPVPADTLFSFDAIDGHFKDFWQGNNDIPYEDLPRSDIDGVGTPALGRRIVEHRRTLYRRDDMTALLPLGTAESKALPGDSYRLALTTGLITRIFGTRVNDAILAEGGYVRLDGQNDWWIPKGRIFYSSSDADELADAQAHFYQVRRTIDPFGAVSRIDYDVYDLLPKSTTDAVGNFIAADNDYRLLRPFRVTDPNGNVTEAAFDCLGQVVGTAVHGKAGEGDSLAGFAPDLSEAAIKGVRENPLDDPGAILGNATSRMFYDLLAYFRTRDLPTPDSPMVYTLTRETHVSELNGGATKFQHAFAYSDGFGRETQSKVRAERGRVPNVGDDVSPRWVGSGWTIYNNKGNPVRKYEPFFSQTHRFEFNRQVGVSSVLFYDPVERVIAKLHPDNTFEKTVFDAWRQESWDGNDTVRISDPRNDADVGDFFRRFLGDAPGAFTSWYDLRVGATLGNSPEEQAANQDAATKAAAHKETPSVSHFDSLGRTCLNVVDNGTENNTPQRYPRRTALSAATEGKPNPLAVFDALGRRVMEFCLREPLRDGSFRYVAGYDVAGNPLYRNGMDGGERRMLNNVAGNPLRSWDARGFVFRMLYDALRRPTHRLVERPGLGEILAERLVYGEKHPDSDRNLKGKLFRQYDGAGLASSDRYDFKGNLLESGRQLAQFIPPLQPAPFYDTTPDWSLIADVADSPNLDIAALDAAAAPLLIGDDKFTASSRFDALNRPIQLVTPVRAKAPANMPSVIQPAYNEGNLLETVDVWVRQPNAPAAQLDPATADMHAVTDIDYNAHGKRTRIKYGNGAVTAYTYDPETFRLTVLTTTRPNADPNAQTVQALSYFYDPVGNITRLRDDADIQNVVYFNNQRVEPSSEYTYDALYRLIQATGREHLGQNAPVPLTNDDSLRMQSAPGVRLLNPSDGNAMGTYEERYVYDGVGNILEMRHRGTSPGQPGWKRCYQYALDSNRLLSTGDPSDPNNPDSACPVHYAATALLAEKFEYDAHGNMTRMPHLPRMTWDEHDRLQCTTRQVANAGIPETTYYAYDGAGQRVRKVTARQAAQGMTPTRKSEQIYLGIFEIYREYDLTGNVLALERETLGVMDNRTIPTGKTEPRYGGLELSREYAADCTVTTKDHETLQVMGNKPRVALVETRTAGQDPAPAQLIRYQHNNHLESAILELDDQAEIISYEEYFPYGSCAYQAVRSQTETPKRYRYIGKERDAENDMYYHGARYYVPWLGRWAGCDPAGFVDGLNLYAYAKDNCVRLSDPTGTDTKDAPEDPKFAREALARSAVSEKEILESHSIEEQVASASDKDALLLGPKFKQRVEDAASATGLEPGLIAAAIFAEIGTDDIGKERRTVLREHSQGVNTSFLGLDDIVEIKSSHRKEFKDIQLLDTRSGEDPTLLPEHTSTGELKPVKVIPGDQAVLAFAKYLQIKQDVAKRLVDATGKAFNELPVEQRFFLARLLMNPGNQEKGKQNIARALREVKAGGDPLRSGLRDAARKPGDPVRGATVTAIQAIHLSRVLFGRSPF